MLPASFRGLSCASDTIAANIGSIKSSAISNWSGVVRIAEAAASAIQVRVALSRSLSDNYGHNSKSEDDPAGHDSF